MISFRKLQLTRGEMDRFHEVLKAEVAASRTLEKIINESRKRGRDHYTLLHRELKLQ